MLRENLHGGTGCPRCAGGTCCSCSQFQTTGLEQREQQQLSHSPLLTATAITTFLSMISMKRNLCRGTRSRPTRLGSEPLSAELNSMASKRWSPL